MAHWVEHTLCYAWLYTPTSQRGPSQAISHCEASRPIVLSYSGGSLGTRLREPLLGPGPGRRAWHGGTSAIEEVAGARAPVCPSAIA